MTLAHHLTFRRSDDGALATTTAAFRAAARCFLRHGAPHALLAFCVVDTHAHALVACSREQAGVFGARLANALQKTLVFGVPLERTRVRPVVDQRHLYATFRYIERQHAHHGVSSDPFHDGSHLPDLVGLRVVDRAIEAAVRGHLPRLELALPPRGPLGLEHLAEGAAAAQALPDLGSNHPRVVQARAAAVQVGTAQHGARQVAEALELGMSTVRRLHSAPLAAGLLRAVEGQVRWRAAVAASASL